MLEKTLNSHGGGYPERVRDFFIALANEAKGLSELYYGEVMGTNTLDGTCCFAIYDRDEVSHTVPIYFTMEERVYAPFKHQLLIRAAEELNAGLDHLHEVTYSMKERIPTASANSHHMHVSCAGYPGPVSLAACLVVIAFFYKMEEKKAKELFSCWSDKKIDKNMINYAMIMFLKTQPAEV